MSSRRDFMGMALGGFTALGGIGALMAMKKTWDPLPSVKSAGFTTIDLKDYEENKLVTEKWRGKPIFVLKQSKELMAKTTGAEVIFIDLEKITNKQKELLSLLKIILIYDFNIDLFKQITLNPVFHGDNRIERNETIVTKIINCL